MCTAVWRQLCTVSTLGVAMEIIPIAHFPKGNLLRSRERRCDIYVAGGRVTNQLIPGPSRRRLYYRRRVYCLESRCKKNYCLHCIMGVARVAPGSVVAGGAVTARKCGQMQHNAQHCTRLAARSERVARENAPRARWSRQKQYNTTTVYCTQVS